MKLYRGLTMLSRHRSAEEDVGAALSALGLNIQRQERIVVNDIVYNTHKIEIVPDFVVRLNDSKWLIIEVKSMPKGLQKKPDALKIVFDHIHLKASASCRDKECRYIVISFKSILSNPEAETIVSRWSDKYIIANSKNELKKKINEVISNISFKDMLPKTTLVRLKQFFKPKFINLTKFMNKEYYNLKRRIIELGEQRGSDFRQLCVDLLEEFTNTEVESRRARTLLLGVGPRITLNADIVIPELNMVLACRTSSSSSLGADARAIVVEAAAWRSHYRGTNAYYILVTSPNIKVQRYVARYLDLVIDGYYGEKVWQEKLLRLIHTLNSKRLI